MSEANPADNPKASGDIFGDFCWHSAIGIDFALDGNKKFVTRLPNTRRARTMFAAQGDELLIHKTTRCLWKVSDDGKSIVPLLPTDVITEDEYNAAMEE